MKALGDRYSQHSFAQTPDVKMARSTFDRSHTVKDTMDFDYLNPILVDEVLPGDTIKLTLNCFGRLATQIKPIMDNLYIDFFFFFVPNRLVWTNWEKFCGSQTNPGDSISYVIPTLTTTAGTGEVVGSLADKFGIPTQVPGLAVNALPWRAYYLIWNNWFRDENLQNSLTVSVDDGPDLPSEYALQKRGRRHDYFTGSLTSPQKGTAVSLPLGTTAPIYGIDQDTKIFTEADATKKNMHYWSTVSSVPVIGPETAFAGGVSNLRFSATSSEVGLVADLTTATAATINQFRQAIMVQSLLELDARGGTRYVELILAHFNVTSPDFRLQRPEFLGGGETRINSHPVTQTSPTSGSNAQGALAAFATTSTQGQNIGFTKSFTEHGYVIGMACARADLTYQQGLERFWSRSTRYDFFWPKLQELGEQAVLNKEIYAVGTGGATDGNTWGYQERYAEYKYKPSQIRGEFRSTYATSLDMWHMAEEFSALPALNSTFIPQATPIARAIAISTEPDLLMDMWFNMHHTRPMATYSVPATLGRF